MPKQHLIFIFVWGFISCGDVGDVELSSARTDTDLSPACVKVNERVTDCQLRRIYSKRTVVRDGEVVALSRRPISKVSSFNEATPDIKSEWTFGEHLIEFRGYLNTGEAPSELHYEKLISHFETLSRFKELKKPSGKPYFYDSYNGDPEWEKVADDIDGRLIDGGDYFRLKLRLRRVGIGIDVKGGVVLLRDANKLTVYLKNEHPIAVPVLGKILDRDGVRIKWEFHPYKNGFIVYGATVIKAEKFSKEIVGGLSEKFNEAAFKWFRDYSAVNIL